MRELILTDAEMQKLVGTKIRQRLVKAGFKIGRSEGRNDSIWVPVDLNLLAGSHITRDEDGFWTFRQEDPMIIARVKDTVAIHAEVRTDGKNRETGT